MGRALSVKLLLDTHIRLRAVRDPQRLSPGIRSLLRGETSELFVSPISVWEIGLLADRGRLALRPDPEGWFRRALSRVPILEAPLTFAVSHAGRRVGLPHRDPADRFLATTAQVYDLTPVTSDAHLLGCPDIEVLPNR